MEDCSECFGRTCERCVNDEADDNSEVMCGFCEENGKNIFDFETLDHWIFGWDSKASITSDTATYTNNAVFIDRGYLRLVDVDDSQCMDHGKKVKIKFCPFCGNNLDGEQL